MYDPSVRTHDGADPEGAPGPAGHPRSTPPTAAAVRDDLRRRITAGEFAVGQVLPTWTIFVGSTRLNTARCGAHCTSWPRKAGSC